MRDNIYLKINDDIDDNYTFQDIEKLKVFYLNNNIDLINLPYEGKRKSNVKQ